MNTEHDTGPLVAAARALVGIWADLELADSIAERLTCIELAALHDLMALVDPGAAQGWLDAHAAGDNSAGDCQHDRWLAEHGHTGPDRSDASSADLSDHTDDEPRWRGIPLSFPNGTPDRYDPADDSALWMTGYVVTVHHTDGTEQSLKVAHEAEDGLLAGRHFDDETDRLGAHTIVAVSDATLIEVP